MELEQRLGLYQVFLKLYDHHRSLLDEILQLENTGSKSLTSVRLQYIQGVAQGQQGCLITNLVDGKTQRLLQPQGIWTIGRDRSGAIPILDERLSRRHGVIQYIANQGFYLIDLNSTNGSFLNGEPVRERTLLQDGDRVRLGSLAFTFFLCQQAYNVDEVPPDLLEQLYNLASIPDLGAAPPEVSVLTALSRETSVSTEEDTALFGKVKAPESSASSGLSQLSPAQQSAILDRFFSQHS
jgi:pSer/pThr/pTyr-binding forkhead associated (FHA) protein